MLPRHSIAIGDGASNNTINGGNVIGDNTGTGVFIFGTGSTGNVVQSNFIGTDATGTVALGYTLRGVDARTGASANLIGGPTANLGNVIADNGDYGVLVDTVNQITILSNSMFGNPAGGIGLFNGANNSQDAPVLQQVTGSTLLGQLAEINTSFLLQVFVDTPTGQILVFSQTVQTDSNGNFSASLTGIQSGNSLTATATINSNTSECATDIVVP